MKKELLKTAIRLPLLFLAGWGMLEGLARVVRLSVAWPLIGIAAGMAIAIEALLGLYAYECGSVTPRRARWLTGLRLAALAVIGWMLLGPSWVRTVARERIRELVVVIDDSASMHLTDEGAAASRKELGEAGLAKSGLLEKLGGTLKIRTVHAARSVRTEGEKAADGWADATDLAGALSHVLEQVPPDDLAGAILVSDGRHNRPARVEDVARRFGILDAPVGEIAVGSEAPPRDAAVVEVRAPEAIHLGDRMRVAAVVKFDGLKGRKAKLRLKRGDEVLEEREIPVPQDRHREEVKFTVVPKEGGTAGYRVEIAPLEGERFADNNGWDFETSITDDRTHVLLVEGYPRWEFRYLRNLFYGRDKSVHLQYVLLHPDRISGQQDALMPASASRPFGEAQATELPKSEAEWRKFDVIILGDLPPEAMDEATWKILSRCVNERAALLVMIAGPRSMPHAIASETGRALVPAEFEWGARTYFNEAGRPFRFALTPAGASHPVTQQDSMTQQDPAGNEQAWASFPEITWRHPLKSLKEGAEVLLTAADEKAEPAEGEGGLQDALDALAKRRQLEAENALLVTRQTGRGKVALLLTDRTWRLREGAGDVHHHRFWGNLVRWGAGPALRAGTDEVRLGTDQLVYTPDDEVKVSARLRDESLAPVFDPSLVAEVWRDGVLISTRPLAAQEQSNGLHEGTVGPFTTAGRYTLKLRGDKAPGAVSTTFTVVGSRGPVELADVTLNRPLLETVAALSGGKVVDADHAGDLAPLFLSEKNRREETRETTLWDQPWVIGLLVLLLGAEWVIRRGGGLP